VVRRFPVGLTITVLVALGILISLGVWQLHRLAWKEDLLAKRERLSNAVAQPLETVLAQGKRSADLDMTRVQVACPGLAQAPYQSLYGLVQGRMVTRLISACRLSRGPYDGILVDRGYVLDTISARPAVIPSDYPAAVTGVLLAVDAVKSKTDTTVTLDSLPTATAGGDKLWFARDIPGIAKTLGLAKPAPVFLVAENSTNPDWQALTPGLPPVTVSNRHLEYALTWFALAAVLVAIYGRMLWRRLKA
jgi:surfeit locus 1 family protein